MVDIPKNMEKVCNDAQDSVWMYHAEKDTYYRVYPNGTCTHIFGKYLPDPEQLLFRKTEIAKKAGVKPNIEAMKSSPAVYSLWNHRKRVEGHKWDVI